MKKIGLFLVFILGIIFILGSAKNDGLGNAVNSFNNGYNSFNGGNYNNFDSTQFDLSKQNKGPYFNSPGTLPSTPLNNYYNKNYGGYTPYGYKSSNGMIYNY